MDAKFKTFGCGSAIASSSLATEWIKGKTLDEALEIKNTDIVRELALPPVKIHCSVLAEDAIRAAIQDYQAQEGAGTATARPQPARRREQSSGDGNESTTCGSVTTGRLTSRRYDAMAMKLTERAARKSRRFWTAEPGRRDSIYLRLGVKGGGCSGFTYALDLTETKCELDEEYASHGIKVICDPKSCLYLDGTTLDFKDEMMGRGFVFNNPNATGSCGCGSSFSA